MAKSSTRYAYKAWRAMLRRVAEASNAATIAATNGRGAFEARPEPWVLVGEIMHMQAYQSADMVELSRYYVDLFFYHCSLFFKISRCPPSQSIL